MVERTAANPWWVAFRADGNPPDATKVGLAVEQLELWLLSASTGTWSRVKVNDHTYTRLYAPPYNANPVNPLLYSALGAAPLVVSLDLANYAAHGYPDDARVTIDPTDIAGVISRVKAKLVSLDGSDISGAVGTIVLQMGCDYWPDLTATTGTADAFVGSMTPVGLNWQWFYGTTLSVSELKANRPPIELQQLPDTALDDVTVRIGGGSAFPAAAPDTLPQGWSVQADSTSTVAVDAAGVDGNGVEYFDITLSSGTLVLRFSPPQTEMGIAQGDAVKTSGYLTTLNSTTVGFAAFGILEYDASDTYLTDHSGTDMESGGVLDGSYHEDSYTVSSATADHAEAQLVIVASAEAQVRIGAPLFRNLRQ